MAALGAEVVDFPLRTACCGGHMTQIGPNTGFELIRRLVDAADRRDADLMVDRLPDVPDERRRLPGRDEPPLPHATITCRSCSSPSSSAWPSALEPKALGIGTEIVSARRALGRIGIEVPPPAEEPVPAGRPPARDAGASDRRACRCRGSDEDDR